MAQILNARELVINLGASHGVERGMRYKVVSELGAEIFDPDTHASLGRLEREKVRVEIVDVLDRMAVGKTYETRIVADDFFLGIRKALGEREVVETIPSTKSPGWVKASDWDSFVNVGDRVKLIEEDDQFDLSED